MLPVQGAMIAFAAGWSWLAIRSPGPWRDDLAPLLLLGFLLARSGAVLRQYEIDGEGVTFDAGLRRTSLLWSAIGAIEWVPGPSPRLRLMGGGTSIEIRGWQGPEWAALLEELRRHVAVPPEPIVARSRTSGCVDWTFLFVGFTATVMGSPDPFYQTMALVGALGLVTRRFFVRAVWAGETGLATVRWGRTLFSPWSDVRLGRADNAATEFSTPRGPVRLTTAWQRYDDLRTELVRRLGG